MSVKGEKVECDGNLPNLILCILFIYLFFTIFGYWDLVFSPAVKSGVILAFFQTVGTIDSFRYRLIK